MLLDFRTELNGIAESVLITVLLNPIVYFSQQHVVYHFSQHSKVKEKQKIHIFAQDCLSLGLCIVLGECLNDVSESSTKGNGD